MIHRLQDNAAARLARRLVVFGVLSAGFAVLPGQTSAQTYTPRDESPENYPAGAGRDDTFYACTACHGFKLVAAQGQNRRQWDDMYCGPVLRHPADLIQAANFTAAVAF